MGFRCDGWRGRVCSTVCLTSTQTDAEPAIDVAAALLPETVAPPAPVPPTATNQLASSKTPAAALPNWPSMPQSPFDELAQQKAQVIEAQPTEPIIPMQPLRAMDLRAQHGAR